MESYQMLPAHLHYRCKYIIEHIRDVVWELDKNLIFTFVSPNSVKMSGYEAEELIGHKISDFLTEQSKIYLSEQIYKRLNNRINGDTQEIVLHEVQFICKNGYIIWVQVSANLMFEEGMFFGYIGTTRNISEQKEYENQLNKYIQELRMLNAKLERMATVDILTGAYNRRKFEDDLDSMMKRKIEHCMPFSMIFFDIDRFKTVNDLFGHKTGDLVLRRFSELVTANLGADDRLYRWGGEEFIAILFETCLEKARQVSEKIRNAICNKDFGIGKKITASFGVCEYIAGENCDQVVSKIDKLLYQAKFLGGNKVMSLLNYDFAEN